MSFSEETKTKLILESPIHLDGKISVGWVVGWLGFMAYQPL